MIMPKKNKGPKVRLGYKVAAILFIIGLGTLIVGIVEDCRGETLSGGMTEWGGVIIIGIALAIQTITHIDEGPI